MTIECVCFDLGGVLVRTCHSWDEGCQAAGVQVRPHPDKEYANAVWLMLTERFGLGLLVEAEWAEQLSRAWDGLYSVSEVIRIHHAWTQREYDGVDLLVEALHGAGVETSCLSNTNHAHWARLVHVDDEGPRAGDPEYPTVRRLHRHFASHLLGLAKPDPAIYGAFEESTGWSGSSILFFDDRSENVAAARARGWRAEQIDPHADTGPQISAWLRQHQVI
jgi:FMN phosphatase YigB (HAD superfamily)